MDCPRMGIEEIQKIIASSDESEQEISYLSGDKRYEMGNHLGNVLEVVTDRKLSLDGNTDDLIDGYTVDVVSYSDYYPFGMTMSGRHGSEAGYRYGFQGQEKDDEVKGEGNSYDFGARIYDPRVGRWLSLDPAMASLPWQSPYCAMDNNPILLNGPFGDSVRYEKFRDRLNVTLKKIISPKFRALHKSREQSDKTYTYRKRNSGKLLGGKEMPTGDPNEIDVLYRKPNLGWHFPPIRIPELTMEIGHLDIPINIDRRETKLVRKNPQFHFDLFGSDFHYRNQRTRRHRLRRIVPGSQVEFHAKQIPDQATITNTRGDVLQGTQTYGSSQYYLGNEGFSTNIDPGTRSAILIVTSRDQYPNMGSSSPNDYGEYSYTRYKGLYIQTTVKIPYPIFHFTFPD